MDPSGLAVDLLLDGLAVAGCVHAVFRDNVFGSCDNLGANAQRCAIAVAGLLLPYVRASDLAALFGLGAGGLAAVLLRGERAAARGGAQAVRVGQAGESAVRAAYNIGDKAKILVNGRYRIPDGLTNTVLSEVKNVKSLSFTRQLRDFADFAQQTGRRFDLYVRPNTTLSGPLQEAVRQEIINLRYIP